MKLITFLCCAVTIIGLAQGLLCYNCFIRGCSDPFDASAPGVSIVACKPGSKYCGKQFITIGSDTAKIRGCAYTVPKNTMAIANLTNRAGVIYGKAYTCTKDLCNGASSITSAIAVALLSLAGLVYIIF